MQATSHNDTRSSSNRKGSPTLEDTVDAELWLNLMTSMMNFAVASTNLMKAIQDKTGVSVAYKDETKKPEETMNRTAPPQDEEECDSTCEGLQSDEDENEEIVEEKSNEQIVDIEKPSDIAEPQSEAEDKSPQTDDQQIENQQSEENEEPENKSPVEPSETKNLEQAEEESSAEPTEQTPDVKDQQSAEPNFQKKPERKTCNIAHQEKEPCKEVCPGSCGRFPPSRIPQPIKTKKHRYSPENRKKLQAAKKGMVKPCGCRTEECQNNPCSCEDLTLCAPSKKSGPCACADKDQESKALPEDTSQVEVLEEPVIEKEVPELFTAPKSDQEPQLDQEASPDHETDQDDTPDQEAMAEQKVVSTEEMSVQATALISEMCCCDEELIDEELLEYDRDFESQTEPMQSFPDFELSTISQHLQQTDENLEELKKEVQRISDCMTGRKRYADDVAAALYREIMKPRTSVVEVAGPAHRMSPKRRDQSWF